MGVTEGGKTPSHQKMFTKGHTPRLSELGECCDAPSQGEWKKWPLKTQILTGALPDFLWIPRTAQEF